MRQRVPSIEERTKVAIGLGIIKPGEELTPHLQRKLARVVQLAEAEEAADAIADSLEAAVSDPIPLIVKAHADLIEAGLSSSATDLIVAALAPEIWRANLGAAHARK